MSAHAVHSAIAGDSVSLRKVRRALVSVFDKTGIEELGLFLAAQGVEILSTGGTAKKLRAAGVKVIDASAYTGSVRRSSLTALRGLSERLPMRLF